MPPKPPGDSTITIRFFPQAPQWSWTSVVPPQLAVFQGLISYFHLCNHLHLSELESTHIT